MGQVGPDVDEQELISSFERHGKLVGYKLLRGSHCGFIDFECVEQAAAAREALHNATFGSCEIRVEFKVGPRLQSGCCHELSSKKACNRRLPADRRRAALSAGSKGLSQGGAAADSGGAGGEAGSTASITGQASWAARRGGTGEPPPACLSRWRN